MSTNQIEAPNTGSDPSAGYPIRRAIPAETLHTSRVIGKAIAALLGHTEPWTSLYMSPDRVFFEIRRQDGSVGITQYVLERHA